MSFGAAFGQLVRRYREAQGLSSGELAAEAFGDEARKSRISELENGKVKAPQAKTIDALRIALAIPQEDIDALRTPSPVDHELINRIRTEMDLSTNGLLENLAQRFGIDNPDAPRAKLESFLKDKAKEWQALKVRLASLTEVDERLSNQMAAAESALSQGHFDEAEEILSNAEEIQQQERTLAEVRKQSQIRATRAEAALLKGDQDQAFEHFKASADMFDAFDPLEGAKVRREHYLALYHHGIQFPGAALAHAEALAQINLTAYANPAHAEDRGKTLGNQATFLMEQGIRTGGPEGAALIARGVENYRKLLHIFTKHEHPEVWALTQNNLGTALRTQGTYMSGPEGVDLLAEAVAACRAALQIRTRDAMPADWGMTQNNLGNAFWAQGTRMAGQDGIALLAQSVDAYRASLQVCTCDAMPVGWAMTQHNLGISLKDQGRLTLGPSGTALLDQAIVACNAALQVRTRDAMPAPWAETQENLGLVFEAVAERDLGMARNNNFARSLAHFDAALEIYDPATMSRRAKDCSKARDRVAAKLAGTWVEDEG